MDLHKLAQLLEEQPYEKGRYVGNDTSFFLAAAHALPELVRDLQSAHAQIESIRAALAGALEVERDATQGEWVNEGSHVYGPKDPRSKYKTGRQLITVVTDMPHTKAVAETPRNEDARLITTAVNGVRVVRDILGGRTP